MQIQTASNTTVGLAPQNAIQTYILKFKIAHLRQNGHHQGQQWKILTNFVTE